MFASKFRKIVLSAVFIATLPGFADAAVYSQNKQANFDVTMKIVADCSISASGIDFGQKPGVLTQAITGSSAINVTCTNTTPYNVGLNEGTGTGSTGTSRYMSGTGANTGTVQFNLYRSQGSGLWGDTQGTDTMSGVGNGTLQTLTVYGEIPVQTTPMPDSYKSSVTATVYF